MSAPVVRSDRPWLEFDMGEEARVLSWALNRPGFSQARRVLWREVRDADLTVDLDVPRWLAAELQARGAEDAVAFLTSRNVTCHHLRRVTVDGVTATVLATVGLSNAETIGARRAVPASAGTINIAAHLDTALSDAALLEALSLVAQARTLAIWQADIAAGPTRATGTGTDCIAMSAPPGTAAYAGMHTPAGEALGQAVLQAVTAGALEWKATFAPKHKAQR